MNRVQLMGNLGQDADIRTLNNGDPVANLSVATNERWRDKNGQQQERTEWHRVVVFGWQADLVQKMDFNKGMPVYIDGKLTTRKWQDQSGQDRYTTEVVVQGFGVCRLMEPLPRREQGSYDDHPYNPGARGQGSGQQTGQHQQGNLPMGSGAPPNDDLDDEIPF